MAKNELQELKKELSLRRAFVLDAYKEPHKLDTKHALDTTTEKSRFGQPVVHAWCMNIHAGVSFDFFTPSSLKRGECEWFPDELSAMIALRNKTARNAAEALADIDRKIDKLAVGSGLTSIIMSSLKAPPECEASSSAPETSSTSSPVTSDTENTGSQSAETCSSQPTTATPAADAGDKTISEQPTSSATAIKSKKSTTSAAPKTHSPKSSARKTLTAEQIKAKADKAEAMSKKKATN